MREPPSNWFYSGINRTVVGSAICLLVAVERKLLRRGNWPVGHALYDACSKPTSPGMYGSTAAAASRSEEHTSELQALMRITYAVFFLQTKLTNPPRSVARTHAPKTPNTHY